MLIIIVTHKTHKTYDHNEAAAAERVKKGRIWVEIHSRCAFGVVGKELVEWNQIDEKKNNSRVGLRETMGESTKEPGSHPLSGPNGGHPD